MLPRLVRTMVGLGMMDSRFMGRDSMKPLVAGALALVVVCLGAVAQAPDFNNQERTTLGRAVHPGERFVAQRIVVVNNAASPVTLVSLAVRNLIEDVSGLTGEYLTRIEIRRRGDNRLLGEETSRNALRAFTAREGVSIFISGDTIPRGSAVELEVYLTLTVTAPPGAAVRLASKATYQVEGQPRGESGWVPTTTNQVFTVSLVSFANDPEVLGGTVFPGQRFLAQRVVVTNMSANEVTIDEIRIRNFAEAFPLGGSFLSSVEVRRGGDGSLLGQQTGRSELAKFVTPDGLKVTPTASNRVPAYAQIKLEIWMTLTTDAPPGHRIELGARLFYTPRVSGAPQEYSDWVRTGEAQAFTLGGPQGLEKVEDDPLTNRHVYEGQRFLAQRIRLGDLDADPYEVTLTSFLVRNSALEGARLADERVAKIELRRAADGALLGETTAVGGLSSGGVRITATANRTILDDTTVIVEVWLTLKSPVPDGRQLKLDTTVWHSEGGRSFDRTVFGNAVFTTGPARTGGLEKAETVRIRERPVYRGETFLMQGVRLTDDDADPYDVRLSSVVVRNNPARDPLAPQHVAKIEVRRADTNALLGQSTDLAGLNHDGVRITTGSNNVIADDTVLDLVILVSVKSEAPIGRRVKLETIVWHSEGATTYQTSLLSGPSEFVVATNQPPVAKFTVSPTREVRWDTTFTFDPRQSTDPDGDINLATFEWEFGDGTKTTKTGPEVVTYRYPKSARYTVKLTVTDEGGLKHTATATIDVPENKPPTGVDFSWEPRAPKWSDELTFTPARGIADPDGDIEKATFEWDFSDGSPVKKTTGPASVKYTFGKGGTFTVKLTVTDEGMAKAEKSASVTVTNAAPTGLDFAWEPQAPKWSDEVAFTPARGIADPDGDITKASFEWNFGDGSPVKKTTGPAAVKHTFGKGGKFMVKLTVTDQGLAKAEKSYSLEVSNLPPTGVDFSWSPEAPRGLEEVVFTPARGIADPDGRIDRAKFTWNFGDGTPGETSVGPSPVKHSFTKGGEFKVRLTVMDEGGASVTKETPVKVTWLTVDFEWEPKDPKVNEPVEFRATVIVPGDVLQTASLKFSWNFGDEEEQEGIGLQEVTHTYKEVGRFPVSLTVTHPNGEDTATHDIVVGTRTAPVVTSLSYVPPTPQVDEEVTFTAIVQAPSDDPATSWEWDFADGTPVKATTTGSVKHTFKKSGVLGVRVRAQNMGGWSAWFSREIYVRPKGGALVGAQLLDNPASTQARIQIFLPPGATGGKIQIFDALGRLVLEKTVASGTFTWDLKDGNGRRVPDGLYFCLVTATVAGKTERSEIGKILVLR